MKIAVIGSGISGLSAAWLLSQKHQVDIYEKDDRSVVMPTPSIQLSMMLKLL